MPLFSVSFPCRIVERNFVPRKRFKRYERALKTCFVRGKRFRQDEMMCCVDDLAIVSYGARRVELACAGPPHCRGSPLSGANAVSAHSTRRACLCFTVFSSLPNFSAPRLLRITFHPYFLTTLILHSLTHSHTSLLASRSCLFFCLFYLSDSRTEFRTAKMF